MGLATGIAVYVVIWWLVLFTVLPWGVRPPENPVPGQATSAPDRPRLLLKFVVTTAISALLFAVLYWVIESGWFSLRD
jgi:predicted secreted protein